MNNIANEYIIGLKNAYIENDGQEFWEHLESIKQGISEANEVELRQKFPQIPDSLIQLLQFVDGTYWRKFQNEEIAFFILGSDLFEYPYYLLSAEQILESEDAKYYSDYVDREYEDVPVDKKIISDSKMVNWLHFSDCMNNGGTSKLFIDFSPSAIGKTGQVVQFVHDPDELTVIAESFDDYLQKIIKNDFDFIQEGMLE